MNRRKKIAQHLMRQMEIRNAATADGRQELNDVEQREFDELQSKIDTLMAEEIAEQARTAASAQSDGNPEEAVRAAVDSERNRINEIISLCRDFNVDSNDFIANGSTVDAVRAAVLEGMRTSHEPMNTNGTLHVNVDEADKYRSASADALLMRAGITVANPSEGARELVGMSLRDLAIDCLSREGESVASFIRMSSDDLYTALTRQAFNPTAAFPAILDATVQKGIVELYNKVPTTFERWTTSGSLKDFKPSPDHEYLIGGAGDFLKVPENGELKADIPSTELLPSRKLDTYGRQFSMTRQAFINDDIEFITKVPALYATKAKRTIDKQCYGILYGNPTIFDGHQLFDASNHNNYKTSGGAPTAALIQEGITKMQLQKDPFGDAIYVAPKAIVVPIGYGFDLLKIFHSTNVPGSSNNDINPLYKYDMDIVESPVLNALAGANPCPWFLAADPTSAKGVQVDYLNGNKTPITRRAELPGTLGFVWDIYLDWGISVVDYRGLYKNAGAAIS